MLGTQRGAQKVLILLTAISDPASILRAKPLADSITANGVKIIVVGLGGNQATELQQLGTVYHSPSYEVPQILSIIGDVCAPANTPAHVSVHVSPQVSTQTPSLPNSLSTEEILSSTRSPISSSSVAPIVSTTTRPSSSPIATQPTTPVSPQSTGQLPVSTISPPPLPEGNHKCSGNVKNIWLDIQILVESSDATSKNDLSQLAGAFIEALGEPKIDPHTDHATRVGIITYAGDATTRLEMPAATKENVTKVFTDLPNYSTTQGKVNLYK